MTQTTVYLPPDLAARAKHYKGRLNQSQIYREAMRAALDKLDAEANVPTVRCATLPVCTRQELWP